MHLTARVLTNVYRFRVIDGKFSDRKIAEPAGNRRREDAAERGSAIFAHYFIGARNDRAISRSRYCIRLVCLRSLAICLTDVMHMRLMMFAADLAQLTRWDELINYLRPKGAASALVND